MRPPILPGSYTKVVRILYLSSGYHFSLATSMTKIESQFSQTGYFVPILCWNTPCSMNTPKRSEVVWFNPSTLVCPVSDVHKGRSDNCNRVQSRFNPMEELPPCLEEPQPTFLIYTSPRVPENTQSSSDFLESSTWNMWRLYVPPPKTLHELDQITWCPCLKTFPKNILLARRFDPSTAFKPDFTYA